MRKSTILTIFLILNINVLNARRPIDSSCVYVGEFGLGLQDKLLSESYIINKFGNGVYIYDKPSETRSHIYYDEHQKLWVRFDATDHGYNENFIVNIIFVSIVPFSKDTISPKQAFIPLITNRKIKIGSTESNVLKVYGKPQRIDDAVAREIKNSIFKNDPLYGSIYGSKVYVYFPEGEESLLVLYIHIDNEIVRSISLSRSE